MAEQISFDMGAIQSQADASVILVLQDMIDILNDGVIDIVALEGTNETAQDQSRMVIRSRHPVWPGMLTRSPGDVGGIPEPTPGKHLPARITSNPENRVTASFTGSSLCFSLTACAGCHAMVADFGGLRSVSGSASS